MVQFVVSERLVVEKTVSKGLPQGAVLSPLLYAIYTRTIVDRVPEGVAVLQFADDVAVYTEVDNSEQTRIRLQQTIETIAECLDNIGLQLQTDKTIFIQFGTPQCEDNMIDRLFVHQSVVVR